MARLFGTDGVRGIANQDLTCELAYKIGVAGTYVLAGNESDESISIMVGFDTRISCDMLGAALSAGICAMGADVINVGVLPTPALAYLTRHTGAHAGVMISASHNTLEYNGIKWVDASGFKLPDEMEDRIEAIINSGIDKLHYPTGGDIGRISYNHQAEHDYIDFIKHTTKERFDGLKVVLDCANGAASAVAPEVFSALGANVTVHKSKPNGVNINDGCGSTHPQKLQKWVLEAGADVGLAFDGDADRLICVDKAGNIVDGDCVMAICALDLKERGELKGNTLVATVMSNLGLQLALDAVGIDMVKTDVGDRYVLECMREKGYIIGGEQSGHIIFLDHSTTGDGILTGVQLLSTMVRKGMPLHELASMVEILPQVLKNARVAEAKKRLYMEYEEITKEIARIEAKYAGKGRVLIRTSGTEPLVRVMIEGEDLDDIAMEAGELAALIERVLG